MEDTMFRDEEELVKLELQRILYTYSFDDLMELNDLEYDDIIYHLYVDGHIILPEVTPL